MPCFCGGVGFWKFIEQFATLAELTEITAKVLKRGMRIYEVPISYNGREFEEGKKLNPWREGPKALWYLFKYRFVD